MAKKMKENSIYTHVRFYNYVMYDFNNNNNKKTMYGHTLKIL